MKTKTPPILFSLPIHEKLQLPPRAEILPQIESGALDHLDIKIKAFRRGKNRNHYSFKDEDLQTFAASFEGQPFQRDHELSVEARDGIILSSALDGDWFIQEVRLTTRRGMTDFIEGRIDRFSIGWFYDDIMCSVCNSRWFECPHSPGRQYDTLSGRKTCELIFVNPKGKETSSCIANAVEGTGVIERLQEFKLEAHGNPAVAPSTQGGRTMKKKAKVKVINPETQEETEVEGEIVEPTLQEASLESNRQAVAELLGEAERQRAMDAQLALSQDTLIATCEHLLSAGLSASRLPQVTQERVRKQFAGRVFKAAELQAAISEARDEVQALTTGDGIQGPGRVSGMYSSNDQFRLAVEDLFGMQRDPTEANIQVRRLRGIQDAYLTGTGDLEFMGGYYPEFALVTANFPAIVANVMNKMLLRAWADFEGVYGWWKKIATVEHFTNLNQVTWVKTGTIASLPTVAERGPYTELAIGDTKETSDWGKSGGYIPLTIEAVLRDDLRAFTRMPKEAALSGIRNVSEKVAAIFTDNSGAGPTMNDTGALFNSTAQATLGGHLNLLTTALGTDYTAWNAVVTAMAKKKMIVSRTASAVSLGKPFGIKPSICLVPFDLIAAAEALFIPRHASNTNAIEPVGLPSYGGKVDPVAVPDWTDATDWAAVVDPKLVPGVMIGEIFGVLPQIFSASSEIDPAMFANDESRIKVRQFLAVGVADDMPLHKNNVA